MVLSNLESSNISIDSDENSTDHTIIYNFANSPKTLPGKIERNTITMIRVTRPKKI